MLKAALYSLSLLAYFAIVGNSRHLWSMSNQMQWNSIAMSIFGYLTFVISAIHQIKLTKNGG